MMACPDSRIQPEEPPPPARSPYAGPGADFFVIGCLNCAHCRDDGLPHKPERWLCARCVNEAGEHLCHEARGTPALCGIGAKWFLDALSVKS